MATMILIVDDDKTLRGVVRESLVESGYQVLEGVNGEEGVALALSHKPDLIISDIVMPVLDGWDFCHTLRNLPTTKGTPFVFLSSLDQAPEKVLALKIGADAFLTKPFNAEELLRIVEKLLGRIRTRDDVISGGADVPTGERTKNIIVDTVEFLRSTGRRGVISVQSGLKTGMVFIDSGAVTHASFDGEGGERALLSMLGCGESRVSYKEEAPDLPANFDMSWLDFMSSLSDHN